MAKFTDAKGRVWLVVVSIGTVRRVRETADVDLLRFFDRKSPLHVELITDSEKLATVLWAICEPQAVLLGVTPEEFADSLLGDAISEGADALIGAMVDFTPHPTERDKLRRVLATARTVAERKIAEIPIPTEAEMEAEMMRTSGAT